ncbi:MAG: hypothetical protein SH868_03765 [Bythopirellula sp.]|nr:hypothetical protein [Bythopirellula sp.]
MDTTDYPSLPSLTRIHVQLATDSRRVEQIVAGQLESSAQLDMIEQLFHATTAEDWAGVTNATRILANLKPEEVSAEVVNEARQLYEELTHEKAGIKQPKHLANLLAACRAMRTRK